jgi:thymidylate synthase (FAD)
VGEVTAKVTLVGCTPDPERTVAAAAKLCYAGDTDNLLEKAGADAAEFVGRLREMGHMSPVEHAVFTFYIEGVSRAMTHQLVRHRLASYSQRSQRYVAHDEFDFVVPPQVEGKEVDANGKKVDAADFYRETMAIIADRYGRLNDALGRKGESSNEDARYVLPNACETKIFMTMNARQLLHFFEERLCRRAQWEIRAVAGQMLELAKEACPAVFTGAGPKCIRAGHCTEGKMTCGEYAEVKAMYGN